MRKLESLGRLLARFQDASHTLYRRSAAGRETTWLAPLLDAGKPEWLVHTQRSEALQTTAPCSLLQAADKNQRGKRKKRSAP